MKTVMRWCYCKRCGGTPGYRYIRSLHYFGCADHSVCETQINAAGMCLIAFWNLQNTVLSDYVGRYT